MNDKMRQKHVVIVNAHWSNRGDEAAIRAIIDGLLSQRKDLKISIIFKDNKDISEFPYIENINYTISKFLIEEEEFYKAISAPSETENNETAKIIALVKTADIVVYAPGGGVISDRFWWKKQLEYLFPIAYAQKIGIPTIFAAPSVGPFTKEHALRNEILKAVDKLCVREEISCKELAKQGITDNVMTTIDSAFLNHINITENQDKLLKNKLLTDFLKDYNQIIGITISDFKWHVEYGQDTELREQIRDAFESFISKLQEMHIGVMLIPQLFGNQNDREYLKTYQSENTYLLENHYDAYFQQYLISKLYAVVGMRYHSNIFAAKMGIPFIPIIYEEKMRGFVESIGWESFSIEISGLDANCLYDKYESLMAQYCIIRKKLQDGEKEWQNKAKQTLDAIMMHI